MDNTRFNLLVKQHELKPKVAEQLQQVLSTSEIVLLCDDSGSMASKIVEEGSDPFSTKPAITRWMELKKLAACIIEFVTAVNPQGLDIYFMNRTKLNNVTSAAGLQTTFSNPPDGGTPLSATLNQIYNDKRDTLVGNRQLLIVVITDGEPTDGSNNGKTSEYSRNLLFNTVTNITRNGNVHVSFAECTDNAEDMDYLDQWDGRIKNFDNTDDYREELARVKRAQGANFKFDYTDYVIKILLATFVRWYFNLDQGVAQRQQTYNNNQDCCIIL